MKRGNFLRSIATLFVAPSIITKVDASSVGMWKQLKDSGKPTYYAGVDPYFKEEDRLVTSPNGTLYSQGALKSQSAQIWLSKEQWDFHRVIAWQQLDYGDNT